MHCYFKQKTAISIPHYGSQNVTLGVRKGGEDVRNREKVAGKREDALPWNEEGGVRKGKIGVRKGRGAVTNVKEFLDKRDDVSEKWKELSGTGGGITRKWGGGKWVSSGRGEGAKKQR